MATVFFLLDALRHDYVTEEHMPFLWRAAHEGTHYRRIIPGFGFCERSEILTGLTPRESGFFTAIGFDPVNSPYQGARGLSVLHALESLVPKNAALPGRRRPGGYYRLFRRLADRWLNRNDRRPLKSYHIPYRFLPYFALTEDRLDHRLPGAFPRPSLLDQMAEAGKSYYYDSFTALNLPSGSSDEDRLQLALDSSRSGEYELFLIFVGELDSIGHHYGPDSAELHRSLRNLDQRLGRFVQALEGNAPGHRYVFLGDHGMGPVTEMFDAGAAIARHARRLGLKSIRDFL
ncbi:MAG: alkaline phosphatase family protein, partial [Candidatus Marinimicrobia bacterium]|nr:alkaline phosphatase family protein [Candidatus Neomarinimicrobiota bacterium]